MEARPQSDGARGLEQVPNNLPVYLTSFVGREAELHQLVALVQQRRLVTLCGSGGCGKTRLAVRAGGGLLDGFADGVWFCDFSAVMNADAVVSALAVALDLRDVPGMADLDRVAAHLAHASCLLILDNCEHLVAAVAQLVDELLRRAPRVVVLATSREPLGISGEITYRVPSLPVSQAVQLFAERAAAARPSFAVSEQNAATLREICDRLDGIPLAIELAAARTALLSPEQIAASLADRFRVLGQGARTALPRQKTLLASVEWSHDLLSVEQQVLFRRLAVFAGSFDLEAAEMVCVAEEDRPSFDVLDLLGQLVDRSMVAAEHDDAATRYRMLETIRQYARDRLVESGEADSFQTRHLNYYLGKAEQLAALFDLDQAIALSRIEEDRDNFHAALDWSLAGDLVLMGLRLTGALLTSWVLQGRYADGRRWAEALSAAADDTSDPAARGRCLLTLAVCASMHMDLSVALDAGRRALTCAQQAGDRRLEARCLSRVGYDLAAIDVDAGRPLLEKAIEIAREVGDSYTAALSCVLLGWYLFISEGPDAGRARLRQGLELADAAGDLVNGTNARVMLCHVELRAGANGLALEYGKSARDRLARLHDAYWSVLAECGIAEAMLMRGDIEQAAVTAAAAEALVLAVPGTLAAVPTAMVFAAIAVERRAPDAIARCDEALRLCDRYGPWMAPCLRQWVLSLLALAREGAGDARGGRAAIAEALALETRGGARCTPLVVAARFARTDGDPVAARGLAHEALALVMATGWRVVLADIIEVLAGLEVNEGNYREAAQLLGGAAAQRQAKDATGWQWSEQCDNDVELARETLGAERYEAAFADGGRLPIDDLIRLVTRGRGNRGRPATGWGSLTPTELAVVDLVCEGLANREVASRMYVSRRTVDTHLGHVYAKLGINSRTELVSVALKRNTVAT